MYQSLQSKTMNDLANIEVGCKVLSYGSFGDKLEIVTKTTKTQIITNEGKYKRDTGRLIGSDAWSVRRIRIPTQEDFARLRLNSLRNTLNKRLNEILMQVNNMDEEIVTKLLKMLNLNNKEYE